jgi:hypothetical protein
MPGGNCSRRGGMVALRGAGAAACAASDPQWSGEGRAGGRQKRGSAFPKEGAASRRANDERRRYLSAERAVSTDSLAMNVAPHQLEPGPPGLIGVEETPEAVWSLVKALQSPLLRSVS